MKGQNIYTVVPEHDEGIVNFFGFLDYTYFDLQQYSEDNNVIYFLLDNRFLMIYNVDVQGELTYGKVGEWRFDKRSYLDAPPPRNLPLPPPGVPESVVCLQKYLILNISSLFCF